jgi:hypothetical protein
MHPRGRHKGGPLNRPGDRLANALCITLSEMLAELERKATAATRLNFVSTGQ